MALTQVHESTFIGNTTNSVNSPAWNSKKVFVRRDRKWSRWVSIKFYIPPVISLCDLILKPKLGHGVCRSESFCYMEKNQFIPNSKLKANNEGVGFPGCIKNRIDLCETYAEPLDVLSHPGLWNHQLLSVPRPEPEDLDLYSNNSQLDRIKLTNKEPSYHEVESFNGKQDNCFIPYYCNDADAPPFYLAQIHDNNYKRINGNRQRTRGLEENCDFNIETRVDPFLAYLNSIISRDTKTVQNHKHEHKTFPVNFKNNDNYSNIEPFHTKSRKVRETHRARYCKNKTRHKFRKGGCPARTWASASVKNSIASICFSSSQHPHQQQSRALTHCCCNHDSRSYSRSHYSMARKRYETAFLPSSSSTSDANLQSPDVDTLLLAIEGTSLTDVLDHNREQHRHHHHHQSEDHHHQSLIMRHHRHVYNETDDDHDPRSILSSSHHRQVSTSHSRTTSPSPYQLQFEEVHVHHHQQQHHEYSSSNSNSSSPQRHSSCRVGSRGNLSETEESHSNSLCSPRKLVSPNPNLPLSEPLPVKRYSNVSSCRGSKHQGHGPSDKRILIKDNSISSLESLDSTKSDDLQLLRQQHFSFSRSVGGQGGAGGGGQIGSGGPFFGKTPKSKLLSPISDKSPLEPKSLSQLHSVGIDFGNVDSSSKIDTDDIHSSTTSKPRDSVTTSTLDAWDWSNNKNILSAAELTNVPWEMPKLRRKLALMADSGISLDLPPPPHPQILSINPSLEAGHFTSRNRTISSDFFSRPPPSGQFAVLGEEKLALASTSSSQIGNPPLAKCDNFSLKKPDDGFSSSQRSEGNNSNDSGQWEKRGNLDLKLPLKIGREDDNNYMGGGYYHGNDNEIGGNYLPSSNKPDRYKVWLDFNGSGGRNPVKIEFDPTIELESQDWFYGAITRSEAENVLRPTKEGSFLVRNCESSNFNQYSLSLKCVRGFIHIRIEPNSLGTFSLGDQEFPSVPHLVLHFMTHRLPIKGAEHVKLIYPVINQLL